MGGTEEEEHEGSGRGGKEEGGEGRERDRKGRKNDKVERRQTGKGQEEGRVGHVTTGGLINGFRRKASACQMPPPSLPGSDGIMKITPSHLIQYAREDIY